MAKLLIIVIAILSSACSASVSHVESAEPGAPRRIVLDQKDPYRSAARMCGDRGYHVLERIDSKPHKIECLCHGRRCHDWEAYKAKTNGTKTRF